MTVTNAARAALAISLLLVFVRAPEIASALGATVKTPDMPNDIQQEIAWWIRGLAAVVALLFVAAWVSPRALAAVGMVVAVAAVFAAAILVDQIGSHWPSGVTGKWPTADQAAILAQVGRWVLMGILLLIAFLSFRSGAWPDVLVGATGLLALVILVLAARDQVDGQFAAAEDPVKSPTLSLTVEDAELIGPIPSPLARVSVLIVTPQRDEDGNVTAQQTKSVAAKIGAAGCQESRPPSPSPSPVPSSAPSGIAVVRVSCAIEVSRGKDDATVLDLLGRVLPDGHVLIAPR